MAKKLKRGEAEGVRRASGLLKESGGLNEQLLNAIVAISGCATLEESLEPLLEAALAVTKMDGGGVYWVQGDVAVLRHHRGLPEAFVREVIRVPLARPPVPSVLDQREPMEVGEISSAMRELLHQHGIRHAFSFPLRAGDTLFGFLNVGSTRARAPAREDIQALWILVKEIESLFLRLHADKVLRESEQRFNAFMDNSPAIAWMRDEQGRYVYLSRTYLCRTGKKLEECRGKTVFDLWPREIAEGFWKLDQEVLRTGRSIEVMEEAPTPDGGQFYWWNVRFPFQDASGRRFVGGIGVDITERKRMETLLQQTNERLEEQVRARTEELNRTIDQLQSALRELEQHAGQLQKLTLDVVQAEDRERRRLAEFLHDDLQQTLAAAKFQVSILGSRMARDKPAVEILEQIRQMLKEAIEKSRTLSHELGPPALYHNRLDAVFEWLAGQMESKHGLAVHVEVRGGADSNSEPVRSFLYRTAQELLFNAAKHAQVQEARLRLQRVDEELWLTVSDKGQGFDPASLAGTAGFGLATIRERARLLGGRMIIKSAPGQGSIFFVAVPDPGDRIHDS